MDLTKPSVVIGPLGLFLADVNTQFCAHEQQHWLKDILVLVLYSLEQLIFINIRTHISICSVRVQVDNLRRLVRNGRNMILKLSTHLFM